MKFFSYAGYLAFVVCCMIVVFFGYESYTPSELHQPTPWAESEGKSLETVESVTKTPLAAEEPPRTSPEEFALRRKRVMDTCSRHQHAVPGKVMQIYPIKDTDVAYCTVPKAGCTFWKQVVHTLGRTKRERVSLKLIQNNARINIHRIVRKETSPFEKLGSKYPERLIVSRDPFSRIISAFLDKAYLPDFWHSHVPRLVHKGYKVSKKVPDDDDYLRMHYDDLLRQFGQDGKKNKCNKYTTFREFVAGTLLYSQIHWNPIHTMCNPCLFNVTYVSQMHTFTQDARAVFDHIGLPHLLDHLDANKHVLDDMRMIVNYNFALLSKPFIAGCTSPAELAVRLWNNFKWRGYISPDTQYIVPDREASPPSVKEDLLDQLLTARQLGLRDPTRMKREKENFENALFGTISKSMFDKLIQKYKIDIEMFGFESSIEKLSKLYN